MWGLRCCVWDCEEASGSGRWVDELYSGERGNVGIVAGGGKVTPGTPKIDTDMRPETDLEFQYRKKVGVLTKRNRELLPGIGRVTDSIGRMSRYFDIDHIVPIWYGLEMGLPIEEIGAIENLQIMSADDNRVGCDYAKGALLPEQWINRVTGKNWQYRIHAIGKSDRSLKMLCDYAGVSYVMAMSAFVKNWTDDVIVDGLLISRFESENCL